MSTSADIASEADLRYPVGRFEPKANPTPSDLEDWITKIESLPATLREAVAGLNDEQLDTRYRPGGWTVRQVVHHLADSHLNCYQRYRLALTEKAPVIKPYNEAAWAELADAKSAPIEPSLSLLAAMHARWVFLLRTLSEAEQRLTFQHPERGEVRLDFTTGLYAWHGLHHVAHIRNLRDRQGW